MSGVVLDRVRLAGQPERLVAVSLIDGRIAAIGTPDAALDLVRLDCDGAYLCPGLVDAHTHLQWAAEDFWTVDWHAASSRREALRILRLVVDRVGPGDWLLGGGWTERALWLPSQAELDEASGGRPVLLASADGGHLVLNTEALRRCALTGSNRPDHEQGVERDAHGEATGRIGGAAARSRLVRGVVPPRSRDRQLRELESLVADLAALGVTEVHDMAAAHADGFAIDVARSHTDLTLLETLDQRGRLDVRVRFQTPVATAATWATLASRHASSERLSALGVKVFLDDGWFSGGPRRDEYRYLGIEGSQAAAADAVGRGAIVTVHAIGDRGVQEAAELLDGLAAPSGRHRITHARLMTPDSLARLVRSGITLDSQPYELTDVEALQEVAPDAEMTLLASPYRSFVDAGGTLLFSTDRRRGMRADLADADPWVGMATAVRRDDAVDQRLAPEESLTAWTGGLGPSRPRLLSGFGVGSPADLVLLERDPVRALPSNRDRAGLLATVSAGRITFAAPGFDDDAKALAGTGPV